VTRSNAHTSVGVSFTAAYFLACRFQEWGLSPEPCVPGEAGWMIRSLLEVSRCCGSQTRAPFAFAFERLQAERRRRIESLRYGGGCEVWYRAKRLECGCFSTAFVRAGIFEKFVSVWCGRKRCRRCALPPQSKMLRVVEWFDNTMPAGLSRCCGSQTRAPFRGKASPGLERAGRGRWWCGLRGIF